MCVILTAAVFALYFTSCSARILRREHVNVSLGEDATFSCALPGAVGVKQVIWQRKTDDGTLRNMVTFTERSKPQVDEAFVGKVHVTVASLHATTIVVKNVSFADAACYVCAFSVYPSGTERETACLTVQGISEITSHLLHNSTEMDAVVSCSATGKPTPTVSWWSEEKELSHYFVRTRTFTVMNDDSTVTTISNFTLPLSQFNGKYVKCVAQSGNMERSENITVEKQIVTENLAASRYHVASAVVVISCFTVASCVAILFHRRRKKHEHLTEIA